MAQKDNVRGTKTKTSAHVQHWILFVANKKDKNPYFFKTNRQQDGNKKKYLLSPEGYNFNIHTRNVEFIRFSAFF